jgi:hypothetical protein
MFKCLWILIKGFFLWFSYPFRRDRNWVESFQFLVVAVGLIVSGIWAYHTFEILNKKEEAEQNLGKAKTEYEKLVVELQELRNRIDSNISSQIEISPNVVRLDENKLGLIVNIKIRNTGSKEVLMEWEETPVTIYEVVYKKESQAAVNVYKPWSYESLDVGNVRNNVKLHLLVGAEKNLQFFTSLKNKGLYLITFKANPSDLLNHRVSQLDGKSGQWFASKYVVVE